MPDAATRAAARQKEAQIVELRLAGATFQAIADRLGYATPGSAHRAYHRALDRTLRPAADQARLEESDRLDRLQRAHWTNALKGDVKATDVVLRIMERRARLLGLDAPTTVHVARSDVDAEIAQLVAALQARADGADAAVPTE